MQGRPPPSPVVLMEQEATYVGLDVAKAQVEVAVRPTGDRWEISRDLVPSQVTIAPCEEAR